MIRNTVNREMDTRRMFAVWRVDPLWKPITKKVKKLFIFMYQRRKSNTC